jgi:hypothetical protein
MDHRIGVAEHVGQARDIREVVLDDGRAECGQVLGAPRVPDRHDDLVAAAREDPNDLATDETAATRDDDSASVCRYGLGRGDFGRGDFGRGDFGRGDFGRGDFGRGGLGRGRLGRLVGRSRVRRRRLCGTAPPRNFPRLERLAQ